MKKLHLLLLTMFCLISALQAKKVDTETAKKAGQNFYYERISQHKQVNYQQLTVKDIFTEQFNGKDVYYAINFTDGGFVVVSSDDAVTPILAYAFEGSFSEENHPPQFISWMERYARQIDYCIQHSIEADLQIQADWTRLQSTDPAKLKLSPLQEVSPLLISTWDQGSNYNALCPGDPAGPDGKVYAGCVATAMSQVMYYYRYPATGLGSHCYSPWGYSTQCADFQNTSYRWNEMLNSISFRDTAVAELLWHCGISVDLMYSPSGSGAYSEDAAMAFINNFRYSPDVHLVARDDYPLNGDEFPAILRDNLDHKRPMYYDGYGSVGHAFNVDGYQGTNFFHFNWGWSGYYNGYFYLNNLNPGGMTFNDGERAMVNIYPDTLNNTYPAYCSGQAILTSLFGTFEDGSGPKDYKNNANASWLIHPQSLSDSVTAINLYFNRFNTEQGNDLVRIYQGSTTNDLLIGTYSGSNIPISLHIPGNQALITFASNGTTTNDGWFATYTTETMNWCMGSVTLNEPQGVLSDGSQNFNYKNNISCRWIIAPVGGGAVNLTFNTFKTEAAHDIVRIIDLGTGEELAEYSGNYTDSNLPGPVTAPSGKMFILFMTNSISTDKGWSASYFTYPVGTPESSSLPGIQIFPNPAHEKINLQGYYAKSEPLSIEISTLQGRTVFTEVCQVKAGCDTRTIDLSGLSEGVYIIRLTDENATVTKKIVIQ